MDPKNSSHPSSSTTEKAAVTTQAKATEARHTYTHYGNAQRFLAEHGTHLRYAADRDQWLLYDPSVGTWSWDNKNEAERLGTNLAVDHYNEVRQYGKKDPRVKMSRVWMHTGIQGMMEKARLECAITVNDLDADPNKIGVEGAVLNLNTRKTEPCSPEQLITRRLGTHFDPKADCPQWKKFLRDVTGDDETLGDYLQRLVGYCLTPSMEEQMFWMLYGVGANGKSTFVETIASLLGDFSSATRASTFMDHPGRSDARYDLASLAGARLIHAAEGREGSALDEAMMKEWTGGDTQQARFMRKDFFEFTPTGKIWFSTNYLPRISGTDLGIWRRVRIIPFNVIIPEEDQDGNLKAVLEAELPGILNWALIGLEKWHQRSLKADEAEVITTIGGELRNEMDRISRYLDDCTETDVDAFVSTKSLYTAFQGWCKDEGMSVWTKNTFGRRITERAKQTNNFQVHKRSTERGYVGVRLSTQGLEFQRKAEYSPF